MPRSRSLADMVHLHLTFWDFQTIFQSDRIILHSHQQRMRILIPVHPLYIFYCRSLVTNDVAHLKKNVFISNFYIFLIKGLLKYSANFGGLFVLLLSYKSSLCILNTHPLSEMCFWEYFASQSKWCLLNQKKLGMLLWSGDREEYIWYWDNPLRCHFSSPCLILMVYG